MEAVAIADFTADSAEGIDLRQGDKLTVLTFADSGGWVKAETDRKLGFIPVDHIRLFSWFCWKACLGRSRIR